MGGKCIRAAFDTVDHLILYKLLEKWVGFSDKTLDWFIFLKDIDRLRVSGKL